MNVAVDVGDTQLMVDVTCVLNAFYIPYGDNGDDKFSVAWKHVVNGE